MRRWILAALLIVPLTAGAAWGQEKKEDDTASFWMQKKLEYCQKILDGLAREDFEQISKSARSMNALSQMENWVRGGTPEYRTQLRIFQNANEQLIRKADEEQLDGAALAYVQLTLSCVNCHKVVRAALAEKPPRPK
jgi:hypothetical protein